MFFHFSPRSPFLTALEPTWRTSSWLLKIMIPVSLVVTGAQYLGIIAWIARFTSPLFNHLGLPGDAAVAFVSGALVGTYGGIASMMALSLTLREATILSLMIVICHGLPMESAVVSKTGSSFWGMTGLRLAMAVLCAFLFNLWMPEMPADFGFGVPVADRVPPLAALVDWLISIAKLSVMVVLIIYGLMVIQRGLEAVDGIRRISRSLGPVMRVFGLPENTAYLWLVGNVLGISYGSAVMLDLEEKGVVSRADANDANYHLVMNHSMLEDTIVFGALGIGAWWIVGTRLLWALAVVWTRRLWGHTHKRTLSWAFKR